MKILHIVAGLNDIVNGMVVVAKFIMDKQIENGDKAEIVDVMGAEAINFAGYDEVWIHGMWLPAEWKVAYRVIKSGTKLIRMTHGSLSPIAVQQGGLKKRLVKPIERWIFRRTARVVVTCEEEKDWAVRWGLRNEFQFIDVKQFFRLEGKVSPIDLPLRVLYVGRRHPLKGIQYLEAAVKGLPIELKVAVDISEEEKEKAFAWCNVFCLPTLTENFGLVIAEALERGRFVITTDGAPAWREYFAENPECGIYIEGFREGNEAFRVEELKKALAKVSPEVAKVLRKADYDLYKQHQLNDAI